MWLCVSSSSLFICKDDLFVNSSRNTFLDPSVDEQMAYLLPNRILQKEEAIYIYFSNEYIQDRKYSSNFSAKFIQIFIQQLITQVLISVYILAEKSPYLTREQKLCQYFLIFRCKS
jgi:hypothetical protein